MSESIENKNRFEGDRWELESTKEAVNAAGDEIERRLHLAWGEEGAGLLPVVAREVLANAVIHGNLGLKKKKGEDPGEYNNRIDEAEKDLKLRNKKVVVELDIGAEEAKISILDEGGFDQGGFERPDLSKTEVATYDYSGLGRGIMFEVCDKVEFSPGKVVLYKKRKK